MSRPSDMQPARAEPTRFTYEDYLQFPDDGRRHELIDGEHVVTPSPDERHQDTAGRLFLALGNFVGRHPVGKVYFAPFDVILSRFDVVEPDILFVSNERLGIIRRWVHGAPDLAVEIVSPSTRRLDETKKLAAYGRFGVREYWVVDPENEVVTVYRRAEDGSFPRVAELSREAGAVLETPLLPGFAFALGSLFA
jgi:Uma2 family endonuclease